MAYHPVNLVLRFLLEISALVAVGYWAWDQGEGVIRMVSTIGLPLVTAFMWGAFRVDGDPNKAPVAIPGTLRLFLELAILFGGAFALYLAGKESLAVIFALLIALHYAISYERILWLIRR